MWVRRIARAPHADLDGRGGEYANGRWHTKGQRIVYCSATASLAILEILVHLDLPPELMPDDYVRMEIAVPDDVEVRAIESDDLAKGWRDADGETKCRFLGDAWLASRESAVLMVPSSIIPVERNALINPLHSDSKRISLEEIHPFAFDERLLTRMRTDK